MNYPNPIDTLFKEHLDGKEAYIRSGGLQMHGNIEQKCILKYEKYQGLICGTDLKYNSLNVNEEFRKMLNQKRDDLGMSYDLRDEILKAASDLIDSLIIRVGTIYYHSIKKHEVITDKDGSIMEVHITYDNGTLLEIRNIRDPK